jgi:hypothetical protein
VPQLSLNGYGNGIPSIPGLCASILFVILTVLTILAQAVKIGEYTQISTNSQPNKEFTLENPFDIKNIHKMAFFVGNEDNSLTYNDSSMVSLQAVLYQKSNNGEISEA